MSNETQIAAAEHALTEFWREISVMTSEAVDLLAVDRDEHLFPKFWYLKGGD